MEDALSLLKGYNQEPLTAIMLTLAQLPILFAFVILAMLLLPVKGQKNSDLSLLSPSRVIIAEAINSTTTSSVPSIFKVIFFLFLLNMIFSLFSYHSTLLFFSQELLLTLSPIDESAETFMPAADAVDKLEKIVGWNADTSNFVNNSFIGPLIKGIGGNLLPAETPPISLVKKDRPLHELMDIVIPSIRDLDFLEVWKPFIHKFHIIIVQDGDPSKKLKVPQWASYELYNRLDIEKALGNRAWIISKKDASIRNFGFLVSDKDLIYTLDDDCLPARNHKGDLVDSISQHAVNLLTPSIPHFFNTIYDPYRPGSDFVRGYPYSLRDGITTGISHGLWMNAYDYDAPTQLLKVTERNIHYIDIVQTIPHKVLYPMCSMNVVSIYYIFIVYLP
jgi:hypothetical protein